MGWVDRNFVMETALRARVICLDIPDDYGFMDEALVRLLQARVVRFLPAEG